MIPVIGQFNVHHLAGNWPAGSSAPFWDTQYPLSEYWTLNKTNAADDASLVFCQATRAKWEFGACTEGAGVSPRLHFKRVKNPDGLPANDQFTDNFVMEYDTVVVNTFTVGKSWFTQDEWLGVGTIPSERLHVASIGRNNASRMVVKFENYNNSGSGSQSAGLQFAGNGTSWICGNDYGMNGNHNWYVADASGSGGIKIFCDVNGVAINGSTLAATEAFRVDDTARGVLLPRMTTTQRDAITGGKNTSLLIFNTTTNQFEWWDATAGSWKPVASTSGFVRGSSSLSSAFSSTSVTRANVTGWSIPMVSGKRYRVQMIGTYQTAATTTGGSIGFATANGAAATIVGRAYGAISNAAVATGLEVPLSALSSSLTTTGVAATATPHQIGFDAIFVCTTSGDVTVQWGSEVAASAAQLNIGSTLMWEELP